MTKSLLIKFAFGAWVETVEMAVYLTYARTMDLSYPMVGPVDKEVMFTSRQRRDLATCLSCAVHISKAIMASQERLKRDMEMMGNLSSIAYPSALRYSRSREMFGPNKKRNIAMAQTT